MVHTGGNNLLIARWQTAVEASRKGFERDDRTEVDKYHSWDDLYHQIGNDHDSAMLMLSATKLKDFVEDVLCQLIPELKPTALCALCRLAIKLAQEKRDVAMRRVSRMLRDVCHRVGTLVDYCNRAQIVTNSLKEACTECAISALSFFADIIRFLRSGVMLLTPGDSYDNEWRPLGQQFTLTINDLDGVVSRTNSSLSTLLAGMTLDPRGTVDSQPNGGSAVPVMSLTTDEAVKFPCAVFPESFTVPKFFDRTKILEKLGTYFRRSDADIGFRSLAIWGLGGIGKSSIALRFAENKMQRGEIDALFWIHAQTLASIRQSFTSIALKLKIADPKRSDDNENVALVLEWLSHTSRRWFLIYDNAESIDMLRPHWPRAASGQAIVTARDHSFAFDLADAGLEIKEWDTETGIRFLFHLLAVDIGEVAEQTDLKSAYELLHKLNGHALAISHMAALIHRRALSISDFMKIYNEHPNEMHGVSGNRSINALWDFSFRSLNPESRTVLGVLSYMAPDKIPQMMFEEAAVEQLPSHLKFCAEFFQFSKSIENLLSLALIKVDKTTRSFSLHRLVQTSFKYSMTPEQRQQAWSDAATLMCHAFPLRDSDSGQMYLFSAKCATYLQHVLSLKDAFREEKKLSPKFKAFKAYCDMNNSCQRYLIEINAYDDLEDLIDVNLSALETIPKGDQTPYIQSGITSHKGQILMRLGRAKAGVDWLLKSYQQSCAVRPYDGREAAWGAENAANCMATANDFTEAIKWHEQAHVHWNEWSESQTDGAVEWSPILKKSFCHALVWADQSQRARNLAMSALLQVETSSPYNWAMAAFLQFILGSIDRRESRYEAAEAHFIEAQNKWLKGEELRSDPFNAACMYRLGCTALDQGKLEAAIRHLRDAKVMTELRSTKLTAEHGRCLYKLSEALEQDPGSEDEAQRYLAESEALLHSLDPVWTPPDIESGYDRLINIQWR